MPQNFLACDREQELLLPTSLREWLPESHLAWFVLDAVAALDLEPFFAAYRRDGWGRAAHDPGDDVGVVALRLRGRGAVVAADRGALRGRRRVPGDHRQPGPGSRDGCALPGPARADAWRSVRRRAGAGCAGRACPGRADRGRRVQGGR